MKRKHPSEHLQQSLNNNNFSQNDQIQQDNISLSSNPYHHNNFYDSDSIFNIWQNSTLRDMRAFPTTEQENDGNSMWAISGSLGQQYGHNESRNQYRNNEGVNWEFDSQLVDVLSLTDMLKTNCSQQHKQLSQSENIQKTSTHRSISNSNTFQQIQIPSRTRPRARNPRRSFDPYNDIIQNEAENELEPVSNRRLQNKLHSRRAREKKKQEWRKLQQTVQELRRENDGLRNMWIKSAGKVEMGIDRSQQNYKSEMVKENMRGRQNMGKGENSKRCTGQRYRYCKRCNKQIYDRREQSEEQHQIQVEQRKNQNCIEDLKEVKKERMKLPIAEKNRLTISRRPSQSLQLIKPGNVDRNQKQLVHIYKTQKLPCIIRDKSKLYRQYERVATNQYEEPQSLIGSQNREYSQQYTKPQSEEHMQQQGSFLNRQKQIEEEDEIQFEEIDFGMLHASNSKMDNQIQVQQNQYYTRQQNKNKGHQYETYLNPTTTSPSKTKTISSSRTIKGNQNISSQGSPNMHMNNKSKNKPKQENRRNWTSKVWIALSMIMLVIGLQLHGLDGDDDSYGNPRHQYHKFGYQSIRFNQKQANKWLSDLQNPDVSELQINMKTKASSQGILQQKNKFRSKYKDAESGQKYHHDQHWQEVYKSSSRMKKTLIKERDSETRQSMYNSRTSIFDIIRLQPQQEFRKSIHKRKHSSLSDYPNQQHKLNKYLQQNQLNTIQFVDEPRGLNNRDGNKNRNQFDQEYEFSEQQSRFGIDKDLLFSIHAELEDIGRYL